VGSSAHDGGDAGGESANPTIVNNVETLGTVPHILANGAAQDRDIEELGARLRMVTDQNRCYLPVELQTVIASILRAFPEDFVAHLDRTLAPSRQYRLPKIVDMGDGRVTYDTRIALKQPDWTYVTERRAG
jgi:hypothetical protein